MTLLESMDRLVYATRLDRIIFMKFQPRNLRWTPLLVIVVLAGGYALMARTQSVLVREYWIGWLLFYGAFLAAGLMRAFGPRFSATVNRALDERELIVKARAHALSGLVLTCLAMVGCFYMAGAGALRLWIPRSVPDWINLGFGIQACGLLLPTLIASWLQPRPAMDGDD